MVVTRSSTLTTGGGIPSSYKGVIACNTNPNYPAAMTGDYYLVSVAGKIGGASGPNVEVGDEIVCNTTTIAGTHAAVGSSWNILQTNVDWSSVTITGGTINGTTIGASTASTGAFTTLTGAYTHTATALGTTKTAYISSLIAPAVNSANNVIGLDNLLTDLGGTAGLTNNAVYYGSQSQVNLTLANTYSSDVVAQRSALTITGSTVSGRSIGTNGLLSIGSGAVAEGYGVRGKLTITGGTNTSLAALNGNVTVTGGTNDAVYGGYIPAFTGPLGGGSITNAYGLKIDAPGMGTNQYTLFTTSGSNIFGGAVSIGKLTQPTVALDVVGNAVILGATPLTLTQSTSTTGSPKLLQITGAAQTTLTAGSNFNDINIDLARNVQRATGAISGFDVGVNLAVGTTYSFVGASAQGGAIGFAVNGNPVAGTNSTMGLSIGSYFNAGETNADTACNMFVGSPGILNGVGATSSLFGMAVPEANVYLGNQNATTTDWSTLYIPAQYLYSGSVYTPAYLATGNGATAVVATWNAVTDGAFKFTLDGVSRTISGLNFSACADMDAVAVVIRDGIRAATGKLETCIWNTDSFIISSVDTTYTSAITVLENVGIGTDISGAGATAFMDGDVEGTGPIFSVVTDSVSATTRTVTNPIAVKIVAPVARGGVVFTNPALALSITGDSNFTGNLKVTGANFRGRYAVGAGNYNPSALTDDYIIAVDNTAAPRNVIISAEDKATGTATNPRIFIIKDESGACGTNNITITLEGGGTIDGAASYVMNSNYASIMLYVDGTNAFIY